MRARRNNLNLVTFLKIDETNTPDTNASAANRGSNELCNNKYFINFVNKIHSMSHKQKIQQLGKKEPEES